MPFLAIGGDDPDRGGLGLVDTPNAYIENMRKECFMARKRGKSVRQSRRRYSDEFKDETVQRLLDGHSATSIAKNLGLSGTSILYRWKHGSIRKGGPDGICPGHAGARARRAASHVGKGT